MVRNVKMFVIGLQTLVSEWSDPGTNRFVS